MYRHIADFQQDWKYESSATVKVLEAINQDNRKDKLHPDLRSIERLAWHLTQTIPEMSHKAGLMEKDSLENKPIPDDFKEVITNYKEQADLLLKKVQESWKDTNLPEKVNMYGQDWEKGRVLSILMRHQTHHRGQITAIMRMLGTAVPGVYGPSKEEWIKHGMPAMD